MSECLPPFHEGQFPTVERLFLDLNSYFSSVEQHLVYFGGLHGLADAAPTRDFQKMKRSAGQIKEPAPKQQPQTQ